jgi:hypothetical protein
MDNVIKFPGKHKNEKVVGASIKPDFCPLCDEETIVTWWFNKEGLTIGVDLICGNDDCDWKKHLVEWT